MCTTVVQKFVTMVREDTDRKVVMDVLEALNEMVVNVQRPVLQGDKDMDTIIGIITEVLFCKVST